MILSGLLSILLRGNKGLVDWIIGTPEKLANKE